MKTNINTIEKRPYTAPAMVRVELDNEISLALESTPPSGPNENLVYSEREHFNPDPMKTNLS